MVIFSMLNCIGKVMAHKSTMERRRIKSENDTTRSGIKKRQRLKSAPGIAMRAYIEGHEIKPYMRNTLYANFQQQDLKQRLPQTLTKIRAII